MSRMSNAPPPEIHHHNPHAPLVVELPTLHRPPSGAATQEDVVAAQDQQVVPASADIDKRGEAHDACWQLRRPGDLFRSRACAAPAATAPCALPTRAYSSRTTHHSVKSNHVSTKKTPNGGAAPISHDLSTGTNEHQRAHSNRPMHNQARSPPAPRSHGPVASSHTYHSSTGKCRRSCRRCPESAAAWKRDGGHASCCERTFRGKHVHCAAPPRPHADDAEAPHRYAPCWA